MGRHWLANRKRRASEALSHVGSVADSD
jgi:hypothetical protein